MTSLQGDINEKEASVAFSKQSAIFDETYQQNPIIQYKRSRVRTHVSRFMHPESRILELNSGTGEDAIYFAKSGHSVRATDLSEGMMNIARHKIQQQQLSECIQYDLCSYTKLAALHCPGQFDYIFSNFAGLNCTNKLNDVITSFDQLLKPGGVVTLVLMPRFCLWEFLLLFKGKIRTAIRRLKGKSSMAHLEGKYFTCTYYAPSEVSGFFRSGYELLSLEGLCTLVPPSYMENFDAKHPKLYNWLKAKEEKYKYSWPWKNIGDYYIISFRKIR